MKEVIKYIEKLKIKENDNVICAVSTGPDSMALLLVLKNLKDMYHFNIVVAHVNHHLRKESDKEAFFCLLKSVTVWYTGLMNVTDDCC